MKACLAFGRKFCLPFAFHSIFSFLGLHRNVSYVQPLALPDKKDAGWGHDLVLPSHASSSPPPCPLNKGPSHILTHYTSLPTTFSWPQPPRHLKPREDLGWKLKKTQKTRNKNVLAASLSLSVASRAVADIWVSFPGAVGGKTHEVLRSLPRLAGLPAGRGPGRLTAALRDTAPWKRDIVVTIGYPRVPASMRVTVLAFPT